MILADLALRFLSALGIEPGAVLVVAVVVWVAVAEVGA